MWIVYEYENGVVYQGDNYEEAVKEYESYKEQTKDWVAQDNEFTSDENVILAKVEKHFYSQDTNKPVMEEDEKGNEYPTKDTYWEFKEDIY
ncbi:hypothetical protein EVU96_08685 [Bacillus infantis]|uniref:hypothetical protein n=1 Tax=Bacillus infantis TaxID=324767 RepID=UPI00101D5B85|nr:hypothetical protein [Bacillus infantis]RYI30479.1 hypothetical protein EVU96_08685 [Bacillus infantis]